VTFRRAMLAAAAMILAVAAYVWGTGKLLEVHFLAALSPLALLVWVGLALFFHAGLHRPRGFALPPPPLPPLPPLPGGAAVDHIYTPDDEFERHAP
jgi:hypothetical protein